MVEKKRLLTLELLRDFVKRAVPIEIYQKNLILEGIETANKRLWTLREFLKMDEMTFAKKLDIDYYQYHQYEKSGNPVPFEILEKVAKEFNVSINWLLCKVPLYPIMPHSEK
ncbi:MAG: helix-turn-helix domain-containing protein [bacterium]